MENPVNYTLQLRVVGMDEVNGASELEILAQPCADGQPFQGRFQQWEPILETICSWVSSSAFHRKAMQRTLTAGLPAFLINRETGDKHVFSAEQIALLSLTPHAAEVLLTAESASAFSTAA